jgi:hypothetical protein
MARLGAREKALGVGKAGGGEFPEDEDMHATHELLHFALRRWKMMAEGSKPLMAFRVRSKAGRGGIQ